jgi:hypothetical protein
MRTVVSLDDDLKQWADRRAREEGVPMTEIVRRALRLMREQESRKQDDVLRRSSGVWKAGDGLEYQRGIREEWEREG